MSAARGGAPSVAHLAGATTNAARDVIRALKEWRPAPQTRAFIDHLHDKTFSAAGIHKMKGHDNPGTWDWFDLAEWCHELRMSKAQVCHIRKRLVDDRVIWYEAKGERGRIGWNLDLSQWAPRNPSYPRWGGARSGAGRKKGSQASVAILNTDQASVAILNPKSNQDENETLSRRQREEAPAREIIKADASPLRREKEYREKETIQTSPIGDDVRANRTDDDGAHTRGKAKRTQIFTEESEPYQLAAHLRDAIRAHSPNAKVPRSAMDLQPWALTMDRMQRIDERDAATIRRVIDWTTQDTRFWQANILSADALRKHFDKLRLQSERKASNGRYEQRGFGADQPGATRPPRGPTPPDPYSSIGRYGHLVKHRAPGAPASGA